MGTLPSVSDLNLTGINLNESNLDKLMGLSDDNAKKLNDWYNYFESLDTQRIEPTT